MAFTRSLSGRLLLLTILIVMVVEVVIFVPSVARFRRDFLADKLQLAELAAMAVLAAPEAMIDPEMERTLLGRVGAETVVLGRDGARELVLSADSPEMVDETYDLRAAGPGTLLIDALEASFAFTPRHIRVIGEPVEGYAVVEITMAETALREAMRYFGVRIFGLSLIISVATALLIVAMMRRLLVRPMADVVSNMTAFREDPEDADRVIRPASGVAEIREAETALAEMQTQVQEALRGRARLAALGEAVAKISHDLRNMLASAQLMADRIETSRDPLVARIGPKLLASLGRAINLCESTLRFGRAEEAEPVARRVALRGLVAEVGEAVFPEGGGGPRFENRTPDALEALADPDHLFRVLSNLARNARQAIEAAGKGGVVAIEARAAGEAAEIEVRDDGPGLPAKALDNLYTPFRGGARKGGAGLGLAIARELTELQGGRLELVSSTTEGTTFRMALPLAAAGAGASRDRLRAV